MPKTATQFRPGQSGNPGGRPKGYDTASQAARKYVLNALYAILQIACDEQQPAADRYRAARFVIRLGFGPSAPIGRQILNEFGWENVRAKLQEIEKTDLHNNPWSANRRLGKKRPANVTNLFTR
jgi:hypothetical protein